MVRHLYEGSFNTEKSVRTRVGSLTWETYERLVVLESAYHGELVPEAAETIDFLEKKQLLLANKLTSKGFTSIR